MTIAKEEYNKRMHMINIAFITMVILFFAILIAFMALLLQTHNLSQRAIILSRNNQLLIVANQKRIAEARKDKILQCKHVYSGVRDVFEIFFSHHPTNVQKRSQDRFNKRINSLQLNCERSSDN